MSDTKFAITAAIAACATVAVVAIHNGRGATETLLFVGIAAGAAVLLGISSLLARLLVPGSDWLARVNLVKPIAIIIVGAGMLVVGVVEADRVLIGWGAGMVAVFGLLSYWIWSRSR